MLKQAALRTRREPLQIPYPPNWQGRKSSHPEEEEFFISTEPRWLTPDEISLAEEFVKSLPYSQSVYLTGAVQIAADDPLLDATHDELDQAEAAAGFSSTRALPGGGERAPYERLLILRERGYEGGANKAIAAEEAA